MEHTQNHRHGAGPSCRFALALLACASAAPALATDWPKFGYDQAASGNNTAEKGFSSARNSYLYARGVALLDGTSVLVDSVPVYLGGVATPSGTKNLLFVVTTGGALLALDAANGSTLWQQQPTGRGTLTNGSPAIDPN